MTVAFFLKEKHGFEPITNVTYNLDGDSLFFEEDRLVMSILKKSIAYQASNWRDDYAEAPLVESLSDFTELAGIKTIKVGSYKVEFKTDGVQVGCTFVPNATVKEIAARLEAIGL